MLVPLVAGTLDLFSQPSGRDSSWTRSWVLRESRRLEEEPGATVACDPSSSSDQIKLIPARVENVAPPAGYWVRSIYMKDGTCGGRPDMQTYQALSPGVGQGQCYVTSTSQCGIREYSSYNFIYAPQSSFGGVKINSVLRIRYSDAGCTASKMVSSVIEATVSDGPCVSMTGINLPDSSFSDSRTYYVRNELFRGPIPPPVSISGVQITYFATNDDCNSPNRPFTSMTVFAPSYCMKTSLTSSQAFACLSHTAQDGNANCPDSTCPNTVYYTTTPSCSNAADAGYKDQSFNLLPFAQCAAFSESDSGRSLVTRACIVAPPPPPTVAPSPYKPSSPTNAPSKVPIAPQDSLGYWTTYKYTSNDCGGDPFVAEYTSLGICTPVGSSSDMTSTTYWFMYDLVLNGKGYSVTQFFYSDSGCVMKVQKAFTVLTYPNFVNGRCFYNPDTQTSQKVVWMQSSKVLPTSPQLITYPAITRDVYSSYDLCENAPAQGVISGKLPKQGDVIACNYCIPDIVIDHDANEQKLTGMSYKFFCDNSNPNDRIITYQNYTDADCTERAAPPLLISLGSANSCNKETTMGASFVADDDGGAGSFERTMCLTTMTRSPTAEPTIAPTSVYTVVSFDVDQAINLISIDEVEVNYAAYIKAITGALAEAMQINDESIKKLSIAPNLNGGRRILSAFTSAAVTGLRGNQSSKVSRLRMGRRTQAITAANPYSIALKYTVDTNIGSMTVKGLEATLTDVSTDGTLDALLSERASKDGNTSALIKVQVAMPVFSNEYYAAPSAGAAKTTGLPPYAAALVSLTVIIIVFCAGYGVYYYWWQKNHKDDAKGELLHGQGPASDSHGEGAADAKQQQQSLSGKHGDEVPDSFGSNPYAGQMRRASTTKTAVQAPAGIRRLSVGGNEVHHIKRPSIGGATPAPAPIDDL